LHQKYHQHYQQQQQQQRLRLKLLRLWKRAKKRIYRNSSFYLRLGR
uniref:Group II intron reverse transcriptase/maturase n=1 Tax=Gongylonema pulchrum TaxID=637853 RepID=A0A183EYQ2_9BILA